MKASLSPEGRQLNLLVTYCLSVPEEGPASPGSTAKTSGTEESNFDLDCKVSGELCNVGVETSSIVSSELCDES